MVLGGKNRVVAAADPAPLDETSPYQTPEVGALPPELPVGRVSVWFYRPLDLVGAGFVFAVFSALVLGSVRSSQDTVPALEPTVLLVNIGFQIFMAGVVAILVVMRVGWVAWLGLRWPSWPWVLLIAPGAVVFMWVVFGGLQVSGYVEWMESLGVETVQDTVKLLQKSQDPRILGLMALTFAYKASDRWWGRVVAVLAIPVADRVVEAHLHQSESHRRLWDLAPIPPRAGWAVPQF
jgi:hypothetical protein